MDWSFIWMGPPREIQEGQQTVWRIRRFRGGLQRKEERRGVEGEQMVAPPEIT